MRKCGNDVAVSEMVGTVMLLGMAIALFSLLSVVVLSYPFNPTSPTVNVVGMVDVDKDGNDIIVIEHRGGEPLSLDTDIVFSTDTDNYPYKVSDRLEPDAINGGYWNIGEKFIINPDDLAVGILNSEIRLLIVDGNSKIVIMSGYIN